MMVITKNILIVDLHKIVTSTM